MVNNRNNHKLTMKKYFVFALLATIVVAVGTLGDYDKSPPGPKTEVSIAAAVQTADVTLEVINADVQYELINTQPLIAERPATYIKPTMHRVVYFHKRWRKQNLAINKIKQLQLRADVLTAQDLVNYPKLC